MNLFCAAVFWLSLLGIAYSYALYPWWLRRMAERRRARMPRPVPTGAVPLITVLLAARNEERTLERTLQRLLATDHPQERLEILVGDDASTDATAAIVESLATRHPQLRLISVPRREGKPAMVNRLAPMARGEILVFTDADIVWARDALTRLAAWFRAPGIGLVAANIVGRGVRADGGISTAEDTHRRRDIRIKRWQSEAAGVVIAPFGAGYAIRREDFCPVPAGHAVDDFFISLQPQLRGRRAVQALDVVCFEDASHRARDEFRRKVRISRGNFQNLALFRQVAFRPWTPLGFHLFSHKVLRWLGPELIAASVLSGAWLAQAQPLYRILLVLLLGGLVVPLLDRLLRRRGRQVRPVRLGAHFVEMNAALAVGFVQWLCGRRDGVWEPTQRA